MPYVAGVDLGTTFSAAAVADSSDRIVIDLAARTAVMPSVVFIRPDGEILTGEGAARRAVLEPLLSAREFKRRLGDPTPLLLGGVPYGAETLTGYLLRSILATVAERMGAPPDLVVLSHPANYGDYKIGLLEEAARVAGSGATRFVPEPVAAAIHYSQMERVDSGALIAVYDLGGGTFDASVVRKTGDEFRLIGTPDGLDRFGGIDMDEAVLGHVRSVLGAAMPAIDPQDPAAVGALARLRDECRDAKEALSGDIEATVPVMLPGLHTEVRITRSEFEDMIRPRIRDTIAVLQRTVATADVSFADLSRVLLVGGSSRIPLVAEMIRSATGAPVAVDTHPKLTVALGTAQVGLSTLEGSDAGRRADHAEQSTQRAEVAPSPPPPSPPAAPAAVAGTGRQGPIRRSWWAGLLAVAAVGVAIIVALQPWKSSGVSPTGEIGAAETTTTTASTTSVGGATRTETTVAMPSTTGDTDDPVAPVGGEPSISFISDRDGAFAIYAMDSDGSDVRRLTEGADADRAHSWSPDGSRLAFTSEREGGNRDIYLRDADGSNMTALVAGPASERTPAWSPDGTKVAYSSDAAGNYDIYVIAVDGSDPVRLTDDAADDLDPAWSPDGSRLVFVSERDGNSEIYVMDADGSNQVRLTTDTADNRGPDWSPDGERIAFASERDGNPEIYVMGVDGSNQLRLTDEPGEDLGPAWSPDGARLVFTSDRDGNYEIYVMDADGFGQIRLTFDEGRDRAATWVPG